ncbi:hypothetical protein ACF07Y_37355 [Streptomyces sp. NPDC016566]|uniref:hypothetical protein n=1 Tax=Streptomyces sp. NPDC016566 TaxID=3364967 RepID=UPI0036FA59BB
MAGKVKAIAVRREGRRWYVILTVEQAVPDLLIATDSVVGINLGIANVLATSDGAFVPPPS